MSFPAEADALVLSALRALPRLPSVPPEDAVALFAAAEPHGLGGVLHEAWLAAGRPLPPAIARDLAARAVARDLEHAAHLATLAELGRALGSAGVPTVALKGPLFAERFYSRPSTRGSSDVDLLIEERRLGDARAAIESLGFRVPDEARYRASREEHHHVVLVRARALPVELHFHAYVGFGERLPSEPLVARAVPAGPRWPGLSVLAAPDELVYLAAHAAAHRFVRLAWLYDMRLLVDTMSDDELALAAERARAFGFGPTLALAGALLVARCGVSEARARSLGALDPLRARLVGAVLAEPASPVLRSATRFVYTTLLGQSLSSSLRYARRAALRHARRIVGAA